MKKLSLEELNRLDLEAYRAIVKLKLVVILDNVRSGHNVGAVFRTSDALLVEEIALCGITPRPPHREILKTAIGATMSVPWQGFETTLQAIKHYKALNYVVLGIEQTDESISMRDYEIRPDVSYALVLGNEVNGLSDEILPYLDSAVEIPQFGTKHSLNISVCAGIVIWHWHQMLKHSS